MHSFFITQQSTLAHAMVSISEIVLGYLCVASTLALMQSMYGMWLQQQRKQQNDGFPSVFNVALVPPLVFAVLLRIRPVAKWVCGASVGIKNRAIPSWAICTAISSLSLLQSAISFSSIKVIVAALGPMFGLLAMRLRAVQFEDHCAHASSIPLGFLFSLVLRFHWWSVDPFFTFPWFGFAAMLLVIFGCIPALLRHQHQPEVDGRAASKHSPSTPRQSVAVSFFSACLSGVAFGSTFTLCLLFATNATTVLRLASLDPLQEGSGTFLSLLVIVAFATGLLLVSSGSSNVNKLHRLCTVSTILLIIAPVSMFSLRQLGPFGVFVSGLSIVFSLGVMIGGIPHDSNVETAAATDVLTHMSTADFFAFLVVACSGFASAAVTSFPWMPSWLGDDLFRDRYHVLVFMLCGLAVVSQLLLRWITTTSAACNVNSAAASNSQSSSLRNIIFTLLAAALVSAALRGVSSFASDTLHQQQPAVDSVIMSLRNLTLPQNKTIVAARAVAAVWTIQFGFDSNGVDSMERIAAAVSHERVSILALLETDALRLHTGNRDVVEYLARRTRLMHTVDFSLLSAGGGGNFGCALLSRFRVISARRVVPPSPHGRIACLIDAVLDVGFGKKLRVIVAHNNENPAHVEDSVLQTDFIGRLVARLATNSTHHEELPVVFLGSVAIQPAVWQQDYYRMVQSDGHVYYDHLLDRSSDTLPRHGFDRDERKRRTQEIFSAQQLATSLAIPQTRDRLRDAARDHFLWLGSPTVRTSPPDVIPRWTLAKALANSKDEQRIRQKKLELQRRLFGNNKNRNSQQKKQGQQQHQSLEEERHTYWEAYLLPNAEQAFIYWLRDELGVANWFVREIVSGEADEASGVAWSEITSYPERGVARRQLAIAAQQLWEDIAANGLRSTVPFDWNEYQAKLRRMNDAVALGRQARLLADIVASGMASEQQLALCATEDYFMDVVKMLRQPGKIYRGFLDMTWQLPNGERHLHVATRHLSVDVESGAPVSNVRREHPRFEHESRFFQQIYYRDVMLLDWWREKFLAEDGASSEMGRVANRAELQLLKFAL